MRATYIRFCSTAFCQVTSSNDSIPPSSGAPSLLTTMSVPPKVLRTVSITRVQSSARRRSVGNALRPERVAVAEVGGKIYVVGGSAQAGELWPCH